MDKKELINSGKVKSVFTTDNPDEVIIEFRKWYCDPIC